MISPFVHTLPLVQGPQTLQALLLALWLIPSVSLVNSCLSLQFVKAEVPGLSPLPVFSSALTPQKSSVWVPLSCQTVNVSLSLTQASSLKGFPDSIGKEPTCQCKRHKRHRLISRWGRSPTGGHGNPLQYSCLENPLDREAWQATVHRVAKGQT